MESRKIERVGIRMTYQKRLILEVLCSSSDHPDIETLYNRVREKDRSISIATVYRTIRALKDEGMLESHDFQNKGKMRYEMPKGRHGHLIDLNNDDIVEFTCEDVEEELCKIARMLGYELRDYRVEVYAVKK